MTCPINDSGKVPKLGHKVRPTTLGEYGSLIQDRYDGSNQDRSRLAGCL